MDSAEASFLEKKEGGGARHSRDIVEGQHPHESQKRNSCSGNRMSEDGNRGEEELGVMKGGV